MLTPYLVRVVCVSLASFFLIQMAVGLVVWLLAPAAIRMAHRLRPCHAAHLLLLLRLLPCGVGILTVGALWMPSYLQLEPEATPEQVRVAFLAAAVLGLGMWSGSLARGVLACVRSRRFVLCCRRDGHRTQLTAGFPSVWTIQESTPFLALAGIFRPQLIISAGVLAGLLPEELQAALRHERAHWMSRDNFKRLLILLAPDLFPFFRGFREVERAWAKFTEWAADDEAAAGNASYAVSLAAALVRVARMGRVPRHVL